MVPAVLVAAALAAPGLAEGEDVSSRRRYRSEPGLERWLRAPGALLRLPWLALRPGVDFAERVDLPQRAADAFYFNPDRSAGWFPEVAPTGSGRGAGLLLFDDGLIRPGDRAELAFTIGGPGAAFARAGLRGTLGPVDAALSTVYERDDRMDVFASPSSAGAVLGHGTTLGDRTFFSLTRWAARLEASRPFAARAASGLFLLGDVARLSAPATPGLPGLGDADLAGGGFFLAADGTRGGTRPTRGAAARAELEAAADPSGGAGHLRQSARLDGYLPLWGPARTLAARLGWSRLTALGRRRPALHRYPILDAENGLRGFENDRFRGLGVASFTLEYRYPVWTFWDLFWFLDGGQAFDATPRLAARRFSFGKGVGVRFLSDKSLLFVIQAAIGGERPRLQLVAGKLL